MDYIMLGKKLRCYRRAAHLTQAQLAEAANVTTSYIGHVERGTRILSVETLVALCHALHVTPNDLLPGFADESEAAVLSPGLRTAVIKQTEGLLSLLTGAK